MNQFKQHLLSRGKSEKTVKAYTLDISSSINKGLTDINLSFFDEDKFINSPLSIASKHRYIASLKKYGKFLLYKGVISSLPKELEFIELPKISNKLMSIPSEEQINITLGSQKLEIKCIVTLLYVTGCRIESLAYLKIEDIYEKYIKFRTAKGNRPYLAIINENTYNLLKEFTKNKSGYVFSGSLPTTPDALRLKLKRALGPNYINPHSYRRYIATKLIKNGANIITVKNFLNHQNVNTTSKYIKFTNEEQIEELKKVHPLFVNKT